MTTPPSTSTSAPPPINSSAERVLVVEDDRGLRELLVDELCEEGLEVRAARTAEEAWGLVEAWSPALIVSDLRLPDLTGLELLERVHRDAPQRPAFVVITAFGSIDQAVEALKLGADDFLTKPLDLDHLRLRVRRLLDVQRLKREVEQHRRRRGEAAFHGLVGQSPRMEVLFDDIRKVSRGRGPVLITGESGTGKELVARAIHLESERRDGPFVPVNCAGVPESLLESEFFGHASGAFTGATQSHEGLFAAADGGTILLDEVGELPLPLQAKLLRVLQEGCVRPVGATSAREIDVRVLVATNRNLEDEVAAGRFRQDLFYRLSTFIVDVPPLRERADDVERLAAHFLARFRAIDAKPIEGFSSEVLQHFRRYPFPGNVRELENLIERAVTYCSGTIITLDDLPARVREQQTTPIDAPAVAQVGIPDELLGSGPLPTLDEMKLRYVRYVLDQTDGNKRRAAALLGIGRRTLYRYIEE